MNTRSSKAGHSRGYRSTPFGAPRTKTRRQFEFDYCGGKVWKSNVVRFPFAIKLKHDPPVTRGSLTNAKTTRGGWERKGSLALKAEEGVGGGRNDQLESSEPS
ncbi:hypothetical protein AVEN_38902-1 [Araneus ventricosus]|uniref:Uncharacterized protein n=1 Tax=Araneus ventricosus TaxID=182803 RepID=A0A4Y2T4Y1_ARAVE|nr:hypothetical protein AVEN_268913-1 [Araneus ventricosus]GBN95261.1 hypothetical protein AVEN_38902-1 [Araneus ventricosus]